MLCGIIVPPTGSLSSAVAVAKGRLIFFQDIPGTQHRLVEGFGLCSHMHCARALDRCRQVAAGRHKSITAAKDVNFDISGRQLAEIGLARSEILTLRFSTLPSAVIFPEPGMVTLSVF